jgi:predicted RNase H-like nuclease (RuvC/YqgF family)
MMDNEEQIKKLKARNKEYKKLIEELQSENTMLWNYLEEIREQEKQLMNEMSYVIDDYITKNMKPIGDA